MKKHGKSNPAGGWKWRLAPVTGVVIGVGGLVAVHAAHPRPNYRPPPGALNAFVNQNNIDQTICRPGWTATIRPDVSYTNGLKQVQMARRHLGGKAGDYEEDHFIPLSSGGAPADVANLWPQRIADARVKDQAELKVHDAIGARVITLAEAQKRWRTDWRHAGDEL